MEGLSAAHSVLGMFTLIQVLSFIRREAPRALQLSVTHPTWPSNPATNPWGGLSIANGDVGWDIRIWYATFAGTVFWRYLRDKFPGTLRPFAQFGYPCTWCQSHMAKWA